MSSIADPAREDAEEVPQASEEEASPRADFCDAIGWVLFGIVLFIVSWRMDRLTDLNIHPLTAPGLVPGLLGIGMVIVGIILGVSSWRLAARASAAARPSALAQNDRIRRKRAWLAIFLCCLYSVVLIGRGLPFWIATTAYITGSILIFHRLNLDPDKRRISIRVVVKASLIGVIAALVIWLVFERLFLVRLP